MASSSGQIRASRSGRGSAQTTYIDAVLPLSSPMFGKIKWNSTLRQFLDAAVILTRRNWPLTASIFSEAFAEHLSKTGAYPATAEKLMGQYSAKERTKSTWSGICKTEGYYRTHMPALVEQIDALVSSSSTPTSNSPLVRVSKRKFGELAEMSVTPYPKVTRGTRSTQNHATVTTPQTPPARRQPAPTLVTPPNTSTHTICTTTNTSMSLDMASMRQDLPLVDLTPLGVPIPARHYRVGEETYAFLQLFRNDETPYRPVSANEAHPPIPSILSRFYCESTHGLNSPQQHGFVAGRYSTGLNGPPPTPGPNCTDTWLFQEVQMHINRAAVPSHFVSTSSSLPWAIRQVVKLAAGLAKQPSTAQQSVRISLIDSAKVKARTKIFHVPPYHRQNKARKLYDAGAWQYGGVSEHLVWAYIPKNAVICDISFDELQQFCQSNALLQSILRLDILNKPGAADTVFRKIKMTAVPLDRGSVTAVASLVLWLLTKRRPANIQLCAVHLETLVEEICRGWSLKPVYPKLLSAQQWDSTAEDFVEALTRETSLENLHRSDVAAAFLRGVYQSFGDRDWRHAARGKILMKKRAAKHGLVMPEEASAIVAATPLAYEDSGERSTMRNVEHDFSQTTQSRLGRNVVREFAGVVVERPAVRPRTRNPFGRSSTHGHSRALPSSRAFLEYVTDDEDYEHDRFDDERDEDFVLV